MGSQSNGVNVVGNGVVGRRGTMEPLARRNRVRPIVQSGPIQTPSSAFGSVFVAVWCARANAVRLSICWVTIQQVPKGNMRRVGLKPRSSSSGVDGALRVLISEFRTAAIALWRYIVYFTGRWYGSEDCVAVVSWRRVCIERSTRAACSPGVDAWSLMPIDPSGLAREMLMFSQSPWRVCTRCWWEL